MGLSSVTSSKFHILQKIDEDLIDIIFGRYFRTQDFLNVSSSFCEKSLRGTPLRNQEDRNQFWEDISTANYGYYRDYGIIPL